MTPPPWTQPAARRPSPRRRGPPGREDRRAPLLHRPETRHDPQAAEPAPRPDLPRLRHPRHRRRHPDPGDRPVDRTRHRRRGAPPRRPDAGRGPRRAAFEPRAARGARDRNAGEWPGRRRRRAGPDPGALLRGGASPDHQRGDGHRQPQSCRLQRTEDRDRRRDAARRRDPGPRAPHRGGRSRHRAGRFRTGCVAKRGGGRGLHRPDPRRDPGRSRPRGQEDRHRLRQRRRGRRRAETVQGARARGRRALLRRRRRLPQSPSRSERAGEKISGI